MNIIGDSHIHIYKNWLPAKLYHMEHATAWGLLNENNKSGSHAKIKDLLTKLDSRNSIVFMFGEIDCRYLIWIKSIETNKELIEVIDETVSRYIKFLTSIKSSDDRLDLIVHGVPPAGWHSDKNYADRLIRAKITQAFNRRLKIACKEIGIDFFDTEVYFNHLADEDGLLLEKNSSDEVHIDPDKVNVEEIFIKFFEGQL